MNLGSVYNSPSIYDPAAFIITNSHPACFTFSKSMSPCHFDTSSPMLVFSFLCIFIISWKSTYDSSSFFGFSSGSGFLYTFNVKSFSVLLFDESVAIYFKLYSPGVFKS